MVEQARNKLRAEIESNKSNEYIKAVGEFLINFLGEHPEAAEKIMTADKTIAKSMVEMRKEAEKKKVGNMAMLTPQEGFSIVLKYFEIGSGAVPAPVIMEQSAPKQVTEKNPSLDFDIKLEDFL